MRRRLISILIPAMIFLSILLAGCGKETADIIRPVEGTQAATEAPEDSFWSDAVWLKCEDASLSLVLLKYDNATPDTPCTLGGLSDAQKEALSKLETGRRLRIRTGGIMESYPAQAFVQDLEISEDETPVEVDQELIDHLRSMGYLIVAEGESSGLPGFEFELMWGTEGQSSYNSRTGELIKTRNADNPDDFKTTHVLTDEERHKVWQALIYMPYDAYPEEYYPNEDVYSEPDEYITLTVYLGEEEHTTTTRTSSWAEIEDEAVRNGMNSFRTGIRIITDLLEATPEYQALPDFERYYE